MKNYIVAEQHSSGWHMKYVQVREFDTYEEIVQFAKDNYENPSKIIKHSMPQK